MATTLRVDVENIQFLERVIFNSVNAEKRNSFDGYRGYVAAMDDDLYMILHTRLKARRQDILVIPCDRVEGISYNNHQVQFKFNRQVLVVRFEELDSVKKAGERHPIFARLLLDGGVSNWHPPRFYDLQGYKKALLGVPSTKPSVFYSNTKSDRRRRQFAAYDYSFYNHANQWDPASWSRSY